eukprot:Opistho-1_new@54592
MEGDDCAAECSRSRSRRVPSGVDLEKPRPLHVPVGSCTLSKFTDLRITISAIRCRCPYPSSSSTVPESWATSALDVSDTAPCFEFASDASPAAMASAISLRYSSSSASSPTTASVTTTRRSSRASGTAAGTGSTCSDGGSPTSMPLSSEDMRTPAPLELELSDRCPSFSASVCDARDEGRDPRPLERPDAGGGGAFSAAAAWRASGHDCENMSPATSSERHSEYSPCFPPDPEPVDPATLSDEPVGLFPLRCCGAVSCATVGACCGVRSRDSSRDGMWPREWPSVSATELARENMEKGSLPDSPSAGGMLVRDGVLEIGDDSSSLFSDADPRPKVRVSGSSSESPCTPRSRCGVCGCRGSAGACTIDGVWGACECACECGYVGWASSDMDSWR